MMSLMRTSWGNAIFPFIRDRIFQKEGIISLAVSLLAILVIFVNSNTLKLFPAGFAALIVYLFVNGKTLGKVFFSEEKRFFRFGFGVFLFIVLMTFTGILAIFLSQVETWWLLGMIFAAAATFFLGGFFGYGKVQGESDKREAFFGNWHIVPVYGSYFVFFVFSLLMLLDVRSGWIRGPIWNVIPPLFLQVYFIATMILAGIVLLPGRTSAKLALVCFHSVFSLLFLVIVLYPGIVWYDPWVEMSRGRSVLAVTNSIFSRYISVGALPSIRTLNSILRGLGNQILLAAFTEALNLDMYWVFVFLMPLLWGFFVPLTSYKMTRMVGGSKQISVLTAFLTISNLLFLAWGKLSGGGSLGILFFFLLIYLLMRFLLLRERRAFFLAILVVATVTTTHILPGLLSISVVILALALKVYEQIRPKFPHVAGLLLFMAFGLSTFLLPSMTVIRGILIPEIGVSTWNFQNLLATSVWELVFGVSEESPIYEEVMYNIFLWLGLVGVVYAIKREERYNKTLCFFMLLAFAVAFLDFRILKYAITKSLFGPGRVRVFRDIFVLPFVSIVIYTAAKSVFDITFKVRSSLKLRNVLGGMLVCLCLSAWALGAVYETYEYYTAGLLPTSIEVEALKYIDEHANSSYVILSPFPTALMGVGFFGLVNPEKTFVSFGQEGVKYLGQEGVPSDPSVPHMFQAMETAEADVGYFVTTSFRKGSELNETVAKASQVFRLLKVFSDENAEIYIFDYKIAPVPTAPDVMAFYWDTPPSYVMQNDLLRVTLNTKTSTLSVVDFWGDIYEIIELNKVLVGGKLLGNLTSIQYFDPENDRWMEWDLDTELSPADQFQFKLRFESDALVGVVRSGESSVDLWWESGRESTLSLQVGDFTRLYIPGLIGGKDSYDINSQEYGFVYTSVLTDNIVLQPAYGSNVSSPSLNYGQISEHCGFTRTDAKMFYDLYVFNNADVGQWVYIEVWLPDEVYVGSFPPFHYSLDSGETWIYPRYNPETGRAEPIRTIGGTGVNWIVSIPRNREETPTAWWSYKEASGGTAILPGNFTESGGAQNRMFFGLYLPAGDEALLRLGTSVYYISALKVSYVFTDSNNIYYGLRTMENSLIKFYNLGSSSYVGGLRSTRIPLSLTVTQDEDSKVDSISIRLPSDTAFSLLSGKGGDTTIDLDADGIPDFIEENP